MLNVTVTGLDKALVNTAERQKRMANVAPVNRAFASVLRREARQAFSASKSPKGERWPPLKPSTVRARKKSRGNREAGGELNSLAAQLAASLGRAQSGVKPLVDTGRARRSIGVIASRTGIKMFFVSYLKPHVAGGDGRRPPKRNPLPFEKDRGTLRLIARLRQEYDRRVRAWVMTGKL